MQQSVQFVNKKGLTLRGMLHVPDTDKVSENDEKMKIVVLFHGFTGHKLEGHRFFWKISKALESQGIASLRFDFSCSGESDGDFQHMTVSGEIQDAREIIEYARNLPFVDASEIYCLGLSLGGLIAGIVSAEQREWIKRVALLAPAGQQMLNIVRQVESQLPPELTHVDFNANLIGRHILQDLMNINPYGGLEDYSHPVLIIHGTADQSVPKEIGVHYQSVYGDNANLVLIDGADHTFAKKEWEEEVIDHVTNFFT